MTAPSPSVRRRGLKPGQTHSGSFKKGHDPRRNLNGPRMTKARRDFMEMCKDHSDEALGVLIQAMQDESASWRDRMSAANTLIEHAHGRPVSRKEIASMGGNLEFKPVRDMTEEELVISLYRSPEGREAIQEALDIRHVEFIEAE